MAIDLGGRIVPAVLSSIAIPISTKANIWPRKPNPDGSFMGALNATGADRAARWSADDVARRMDFSLRSAYAHGTRAVRTHLDSVAPQEEISWPVFETMRETWRGRIDCRPPACSASKAFVTGNGSRNWPSVLPRPKGVLGVVTYMVPDLEELLDKVFRTGDQARARPRLSTPTRPTMSRRSPLKKIAEASLWNGFEGNILVGHCCSLARQPDLDVLDTLDKWRRQAWPWCRCRCATSICRTGATTARHHAGAA